MAGSRFRLSAAVLGLVDLILTGRRDNALALLDNTIAGARAARARGVFLHCVTLGRAMKLMYALPPGASRAAASSDDILSMLAEREWADAADDGLRAAAAAVACAEEVVARRGPAAGGRPSVAQPMPRNTSNASITKRGSVGAFRASPRSTASREPAALLCIAASHLSRRGAVHLSPLLIPFLLLMLDTVIGLGLGSSPIDDRIPSDVLPELLRQLRSAAIAFPRYARGALVLCTVAAGRFGEEAVTKRQNGQTLTREVKALRAAANACAMERQQVLQHRLLSAASLWHATDAPTGEALNVSAAAGEVARDVQLQPPWTSPHLRNRKATFIQPQVADGENRAAAKPDGNDSAS